MNKLTIVLALLLAGCAGAATNTGLLATQTSSKTTVEEAELVEFVTNNNEVPEWALWAMGGGIFCFALIIPSPFSFKGFK